MLTDVSLVDERDENALFLRAGKSRKKHVFRPEKNVKVPRARTAQTKEARLCACVNAPRTHVIQKEKKT